MRLALLAFLAMSPSPKRQRQRERQQQLRTQAAVQEKKEQQKRTWLGIGGIVALVVLLALAFSIFGGGNDSKDDDSASPNSTEATGDEDNGDADEVECPPVDGVDSPQLNFAGPPPNCLEEGATYEAILDTTAGEIRVALNTSDTPNTTNNFVFLARYGYYNGTELFRSNTGIDILQGGSPHTNSGSDPGPGYTIPDEGSDWTYEPGDLAMARTSMPDSAGAQFFFSTGPGTANLDVQGTYVVFGKTIEGLDVLEAIMATHQSAGDDPTEGSPNPRPTVNKVTIVQS